MGIVTSIGNDIGERPPVGDGSRFFPMLLDQGIAVADCRLDSYWESSVHLVSEELPFFAKMQPVRQREFASGRDMGRLLLLQLGLPATAIVPRHDRSPAWPHGVVGSITHSRDVCAVALTNDPAIAGLGIDLEPARPIESELWSMICRPDELAWIVSACHNLPADFVVAAIFSFKEAFFKAFYPLTGTFLDFTQVSVKPPCSAGVFEIALADRPAMGLIGETFLGSFTISEGHIASSLVISRRRLVSGHKSGNIGNVVRP